MILLNAGYTRGPSGARGRFPDVGDRCRNGACTGVGKPIELLNRAQDIVVGDPLPVSTGLHHGPDEKGYNPVILFSVIFVPRHDQQAIVLLRPLNVGIQTFQNPTITGPNRLRVLPVVHAVDLVRHDHAYCRELAVIGGKTRHGQIGRRRDPIGYAVLPIHPGIMFTFIQPHTANNGAD